MQIASLSSGLSSDSWKKRIRNSFSESFRFKLSRETVFPLLFLFFWISVFPILEAVPETAFQIDIPAGKENNLFFAEPFRLLSPSRDTSASRVDDPVTGELQGMRCLFQHSSGHSRMTRRTRQKGKLSLGCNLSLRDNPDQTVNLFSERLREKCSMVFHIFLQVTVTGGIV